MDKKTKKKISIIVCVAVIVIAVVATSLFFGIRSYRDRQDNIVNVSSSEESSQVLTNSINESIARQEVSPNFNGTYKYSRIAYISFYDKFLENTYQQLDPNSDEIERLCRQNGVDSPNSLRDKLANEKANEVKSTDEYLILQNGSFNINHGLNNPYKNGYYCGNDNLSVVTDSSGKFMFYVSLNYLNIDCTKTTNSYSNSNNSKLTNIYVMKTFFSEKDPNLALFTVTYIYEMIKSNKPNIPDDHLTWKTNSSNVAIITDNITGKKYI